MKTLITPFLWFDREAEPAARFYTGIFPKSKIRQVTRYGNHGPGPEGSVMTVDFVLNGARFTALNGGPHWKFTPAVSFVIHCDTQKEIDHYWGRLARGGKIVQCGWLTDKFGLSWQIVPAELPKLLDAAQPERSNRVMAALLNMRKLNLARLRKAFRG